MDDDSSYMTTVISAVVLMSEVIRRKASLAPPAEAGQLTISPAARGVKRPVSLFNTQTKRQYKSTLFERLRTPAQDGPKRRLLSRMDYCLESLQGFGGGEDAATAASSSSPQEADNRTVKQPRIQIQIAIDHLLRLNGCDATK